MSSRPGAVRGVPSGTPGEIDYRLARAARLAEFRSGNLTVLDVCDAQPELLRNAERASKPTRRRCPVCTKRNLVIVTYVFGPRLPPSGRCITAPGELTELSRRRGEHAAYEVEVCKGCRWNHLVRTYLLQVS
ncbi:MAG: DUF5318 family protein [Acidimicrobiia bacterium]|nr:DUF5318 family protein [Acidimicrobiia bacterium]